VTNSNSSPFLDELRIIPMGWNVAAVVGFVCADVFFGHIIPRLAHHHNLPRQPFWALIAFLGAALLAIMIALIGYVYADAKRRGMHAVLWVLLIVLIPKPVGFLAYFLLRKPLLQQCPQCGAPVQADYHFCPICHHALGAVCNRCGRPISAGYAYCPYCGQGVGAPLQPPPAPTPAQT
jgi:RNA polymerase subunit RPABC4/transcription elongation factor Spt4